MCYIPKQGAFDQENTGRPAMGANGGSNGGTELCPQEADASPASVAVDSLENVVVRNTKGWERRQAYGKEKYAD